MEDDQGEGDESEYGGDSALPNKRNALEKLKNDEQNSKSGLVPTSHENDEKIAKVA